MHRNWYFGWSQPHATISPCPCKSTICMYGHVHAQKSPMTHPQAPWTLYFNVLLFVHCLTFSCCPMCHVATLMTCLPPPPTMHTFCTCTHPPFHFFFPLSFVTFLFWNLFWDVLHFFYGNLEVENLSIFRRLPPQAPWQCSLYVFPWICHPSRRWLHNSIRSLMTR